MLIAAFTQKAHFPSLTQAGSQPSPLSSFISEEAAISPPMKLKRALLGWWNCEPELLLTLQKVNSFPSAQEERRLPKALP